MFLCPWDFPDKNTVMSYHSLLQGLSPTQGLNPGLSTLQIDSLLTEPPGTPVALYTSVQINCSVMSDSLWPYGLQNARLPYHQLPELTQTHVHQVSDTIQPSHPLSSPSPPVFSLSQYQGVFQWVSSSHQVAKVLEFQLQNQYFQWIFRTDFL